MPSPVVFFQIASPNPAKTREFFAVLFDWQFADTGSPVTPIAIEPGGPADFDPKGSFMQLPAGAAPYISIFIRVDDLDATLAKVPDAGGRLILPRTRLPTGTDVSVIASPEGLVIGIVQA